MLLQRRCSVLQSDAVGCRAIECLAPSFGVCCSVDAASLQCCCSDVAVFGKVILWDAGQLNE